MTRIGAVGALLEHGDVIGVLRRPVAVRLVGISESGCLIESLSPIEPGATCTLRTQVGGTAVFTTARAVRRAEAHRRGTVYRIGMQFVWTDQEMRLAFRRALRTLRRVTDSAGRPAEGEGRPPGRS